MYLHILHDARLQAIQEALGLSNDGHSGRFGNSGLEQDIVDFTELILKNNNFEFDDKHYVPLCAEVGNSDRNLHGSIVCQYIHG